MIKYIIFLLIIINLSPDLFSYEERGDSIIVNTFTFDSITTRRGIFELPPKAQYEKVIMHYTLKCDPRTTRDNLDCGEWDYLTYTTVRDTLGRYDSTENVQYRYAINGETPDIIYQGNESPYRIERRKKWNYKIISYDAKNTFDLDNEQFLVTQFKNHKIELKYDLTGSGLNKLSAIRFPIINQTGIAKNFKVQISQIVDGKIDYTKAQVIYNDDVDFSKISETLTLPLLTELNLSNPKIAIILSIEGGQSFDLKTIASSTNSLTNYLQETNHFEFNGNSYVEIPKEALSSIDKEITIAFWARGNKYKLPYNTQIFEAVNNQNQRVLNSHLPWSNKRIYWDAGNDGASHDRIDFEAAESDFEGEWAFWTFTKNSTTGEMKIYRNGEVVHSGVDKKRDMTGIERFRIASGATTNGRWDGDMKDFAIWDKELTKEQINQFKTGITLGIDDMLVYYKLDKYINRNKVEDFSNNNFDAIAIGLPNIIKTKSTDLFRSLDKIDACFAMSFIEGTFETEIIESTEDFNISLSTSNLFTYNHKSPKKIIPAYLFNSKSNELRTATDTTFINYPYDFFYVYDEDMKIIDSVETTKTKLNDNSKILWYNPTVDYEIDRFITPYGIGLDLGDDGFLWKVDVTEFSPVLNGFIDLRAGNDQELLDLKFIFIKGTPARNVNSLRQIWGAGGSYSAVVANNVMAPVDLKLDENSSQFRVITRSSGHGFGGDPNVTDNCSEFCAREHSLWINGSQEFAWTGWKECGDNPVYPQGGTWILDRTDWCPGAPVTTYRHEIGEFVKAGDIVNFDYEIENPTKFTLQGNWVFTGYLVEYGDFNFKSDAAISEIISPSNHDEFLRYNPICDNSRVLISNNGSEAITSLEVKWSIDDKYEGIYTWQGEIPSLASQEIEIPLDFAAFEKVAYTDRIYKIEILKVNGKEDEYSRNNRGTSYFNEVDNYFKNTTIEMRSSDWSYYNYTPPIAYQFNDITRNKELAKRTQFENNKQYNEEFELENGCYEYLIEAQDGYGLSYWNLSNVAAGSLRFRSENLSETVRTEFGNFFYKQFKVADKPGLAGIESDEIVIGDIAKDENKSFTIEIFPENELGINIKKVEFTTSIIKEYEIVSFEPDVQFPYFIEDGESLKINIKYTQLRTGIRKGTLRIESNDANEPLKSVNVIAFVDMLSVKDFDNNTTFKLSDNPVKDKTTLIINSAIYLNNLSIDIYDLLGNKVSNIFTGSLNKLNDEIPLNFSGLSRGQYYISIRNESYVKTLPLILD